MIKILFILEVPYITFFINVTFFKVGFYVKIKNINLKKNELCIFSIVGGKTRKSLLETVERNNLFVKVVKNIFFSYQLFSLDKKSSIKKMVLKEKSYENE